MTIAWSDLNKDGMRLERIIKQCETKFNKYEHDDDLRLAYLDRLLKATHQKTIVVETVLSVRKALKDVKFLTKRELI